MNCTTGKYCSATFIWMVADHLVQYNKDHSCLALRQSRPCCVLYRFQIKVIGWGEQSVKRSVWIRLFKLKYNQNFIERISEATTIQSMHNPDCVFSSLYGWMAGLEWLQFSICHEASLLHLHLLINVRLNHANRNSVTQKIALVLRVSATYNII